MAGNFYELLEVDRDASRSDIKRAYREKAREYHPDVNEDPRARDQFATLNKARDVLTNPKERDRYDRLGHRDYVSQHLDGLPTMSRPGESEAAEGNADVRTSDDGDATGTGAGGTATGTGERTAGSTDVGTDSGSSGPSTDSGTSTSTQNADSSRSAGDGSSSTAKRSRTGRTPSGKQSSTGSARGTRTERTSRTTRRRSAETGASAHRRGLQRGWNASLIAFLLYLGGLVGYVWGATDVVAEVGSGLVGDPVGTLLTRSALPDPATVVTVATAALADGVVSAAALAGVAVAVGFAALPLAIGVTVAKYGRGSAYLYVAAVAVPACWTAVRPFVQAPVAVDLLALAVVPLVGGAWFLVDIGRYLRSAD